MATSLLDLRDPDRHNIAEVANLVGVRLDRAAGTVSYDWIDIVDWGETSGEVGLWASPPPTSSSLPPHRPCSHG